MRALYVIQGAGAGIRFGPAGLSRKEHHVSDGPSHRGGRENLCVLRRG